MPKEEMMFGRQLEKIFTDWIVKEATDCCGYDESDNVEIVEYRIYYYVKSHDFAEGFFRAEISLDDAVKLHRDFWEDLHIDIRMTVDGEKEPDYYTDNIVKFRDFMEYAGREGFIDEKHTIYYMTTENYLAARKQLERILSKAGGESEELYFACEFMMLTMKEVSSNYQEILSKIESALNTIADHYMVLSGPIQDRPRICCDANVRKAVADCYCDNHKEAVYDFTAKRYIEVKSKGKKYKAVKNKDGRYTILSADSGEIVNDGLTSVMAAFIYDADIKDDGEAAN